MRIAIIGSRSLCPVIVLKNTPDLIISGGAIGVDTIAKQYAIEHNIPFLEFLPEYGKYPAKSAPIIRNKKIVDNCDVLIAYWDGKSKGTKMTIDYATKKGKKVYIRQ